MCPRQFFIIIVVIVICTQLAYAMLGLRIGSRGTPATVRTPMFQRTGRQQVEPVVSQASQSSTWLSRIVTYPRSFYTSTAPSYKSQKTKFDISKGLSNGLSNFIRWMTFRPTPSSMMSDIKQFLKDGTNFDKVMTNITSGAYNDIINVTRHEDYITNIQDRNVSILDDCLIELLNLDIGLQTTASGSMRNFKGTTYKAFFDPQRTPQLMQVITALMDKGSRIAFISESNMFTEIARVYGLFGTIIPIDLKAQDQIQAYLDFLKKTAKQFFTPGTHFVYGDPNNFEVVFMETAYWGRKGPKTEYSQEEGYHEKTYHMQSSPRDIFIRKLGLTSSATETDIKKRYYVLIKELHPDKLRAQDKSTQEISKAEKKLQRLTAAYTAYKKSHGK